MNKTLHIPYTPALDNLSLEEVANALEDTSRSEERFSRNAETHIPANLSTWISLCGATIYGRYTTPTTPR